MEKINEVNIKTASCPFQLRITDMRFTDIMGAPTDCTILRTDTNQEIGGYGKIWDFSNRFCALELERLILGESPHGINHIFRGVRQFGGHARQDGGIGGIEAAPWDLAGKAHGIPVYQMLGGRYRDSMKICCDADVGEKYTGLDMGRALRSRMDSGYATLKMNLGVGLLANVEGTLNVPLGYVERMRRFNQEELSFGITDKRYAGFMSVPHPFTGLSITETDPDYLEDYIKQAGDVVGYEIPLVIGHIRHMNYQTCLKLARRLEKFNIFWVGDCIPWFYAEQWKALSGHTCIPMYTGEDIFGRKAFHPLTNNRAISVIHLDVLTARRIGEILHIITVAEEKGTAAAVHMAETPVGCMAAAHICVVAGDNLLAMEYHVHDVDWRDNMAKRDTQPIMDRGWLKLKDRPGLRIEELDGEVLVSHINPQRPGSWKSTDKWDRRWPHDRIWS